MLAEDLKHLKSDLAASPASASSRCADAKPINVCLLGATFGTNNMGVNALTVGAVKTILCRWPEARVFLLDYAKEPCDYAVPVGQVRVDVPVVIVRFSKQVYLRNHIAFLLGLAVLCRLAPVEAFRNWIARHNPCLSAIDRAAFAASVAGGDSFSDIYGLTAFLYVTLPQILCLLWRKPLFLMPQTYGPFRNPLVRAVAKWVLRRAAMICSRDYRGIQTVAELMGEKRRAEPFFLPDMGLVLDPAAPADSGIIGLAPRQSSPLVGLNVSGLLSGRGAKYGVRAGFESDYDSMVIGLIDFLIRSKRASVLLIPHVFGAAKDSDTLVCERLYRELQPRYPGRLGFAAGKYDQGQIKSIIGSCDFFLGSRMHACIAAISQAVPAVSLAYSDKFIGVMETMGLAPLVVDLRTSTEAEIHQIIDSAMAGAAEWHARLEVEIPKAKMAILGLFAAVNDSITTAGPCALGERASALPRVCW